MLQEEQERVRAIYARHADIVYRVCFSRLGSAADAEDCVSDTFYKLLNTHKAFESAEHEKAWLLRVAINSSKNMRKRRAGTEVALSEATAVAQDTMENGDVLAALLALPEKLKTPVYLYYYEGYTGKEIAELLRVPHSTMRNRIAEARRVLKEKLGEDYE